MKICLDCGTENMFVETLCSKCGACLAIPDISLTHRPKIRYGISKFRATDKIPGFAKLFITIGFLILVGAGVYGYELIIGAAFKLGLSVTLTGIILACLFWISAKVLTDLKEIKEVIVYIANQAESRKES